MKKSILLLIIAVVIIGLSGCNKTDNTGNGRLIIKITDAPFPINFVESATVTITKVELRKAGDGIQDGNPFIVVYDKQVTVDLFSLRNGLVEQMSDLEIPAGKYDLVRVYVEDAGLKIKDGGNYNVKVPGGQQTGIKVFINPGLIVEGGLTSEVLLDFDLSRSFVLNGNMNTPAGIKGFHFKPVIRAVNNTTAGRLEGNVTDTLKVKIKEAAVWVKKDTVVASTIADTLGHFKIIGIPAGTYSVFAAKENYDTLKIDGVKVFEGNRTTLNLELIKK